MTTDGPSHGWNDLVDELEQLERFFPLLGAAYERDELEDEIDELEALLATAGEPTDLHSMQALTFLHTELALKKAMLDEL